MKPPRQLKPFPVVKTVEEARVIMMAGGGCGVDMTDVSDEERFRMLDELEKLGFGSHRRSAEIQVEGQK
jgi:hypothetical protein